MRYKKKKELVAEYRLTEVFFFFLFFFFLESLRNLDRQFLSGKNLSFEWDMFWD